MFAKPHTRKHAVNLVLMALIITGCSHQVRTFFFTGVPEPGQEQVGETEQAETKGAASSRTSKRSSSGINVTEFLHGPFGAVACNLCHLDPADRKFGVSVRAPTSRPGRQLAFPEESLCVGCHSEMAAAEVAAAGLWQHGPVASGACTSCHNPHKTKRRYMLMQTTNAAMCGQCHSPQALRHTPQHSRDPAADCTGCHNPHAGRSRFLLKAEYDERQRFGGP